MNIVVNSRNVKYSESYIESKYDYQYTRAEKRDNTVTVTPLTEHLVIKTHRKVPRLGVMLVGWGGNNGSTFTAGIIANKLGLSWRTKRGVQKANWYGSLTQTSTIHLGDGVNVPLQSLVPTVQPDDIVVDGWDINDMNLAEAVERAQVLEPELQSLLKPHLSLLKPRPSIYKSDFIAANQSSRANNVLEGTHLEQIRKICEGITDFKNSSDVETVIILWTANTERFCDITQGVNDTSQNLKTAIAANHSEISPSTLFAYAAISMGCTFINGSPQNTFVPGLLEFAEERGIFLAGDDFKSGQTKLKSVIVDFLISAGIKPVSIISYNHLGNNDGKNLSEHEQFKSKEISKSNVVDDMVQSNDILYKPGEKPDHVVVIKYAPYVGDSKRAMDEYVSEIMMGGQNTLAIHNTCEDSLLATPIILDLIVLAEFCTRIRIKKQDQRDEEYLPFHSVLSLLSYLCKAPLVPNDTPVVNALFRQRACIENILKACIGLPPDNNMLLEYKALTLMEDVVKTPPPKKVKYDNGHDDDGVIYI